PGRGKARTAALATPAAPPVRGADDPPLPRHPAARLHVRLGTEEQILDGPRGVRPAAFHRGRVHDRRRAAAPTGPARPLASRLRPVARPRDLDVVRLPLLRGRADLVGPEGAASRLPGG